MRVCAWEREVRAPRQSSYVVRRADATEAGIVSYLRMASMLSLEMPGQSLAAIRGFMNVLPDIDAQLLAGGSYFLADKEGDLIGGAGWSVLPLVFRAPTLVGSDGQPTGLALGEDSVLVRGFFLDPDLGRNGAGAALLSQVEASAIAVGYSAAEMVVPASSQLPYRSLGFRPVRKLAVGLERDIVLPLLQIRKRLTSRLAVAA